MRPASGRLPREGEVVADPIEEHLGRHGGEEHAHEALHGLQSVLSQQALEISEARSTSTLTSHAPPRARPSSSLWAG